MKKATLGWLFWLARREIEELLLLFCGSSGSGRSCILVLASGSGCRLSRSSSRGGSRSGCFFFFATGSQSSGQHSGQNQGLLHVFSLGIHEVKRSATWRFGVSLRYFIGFPR
jgi:hypothetical protein